ncbi:hypothetical protein SDC9_88438 [bioreactor metagenome]|uniref:Uncharacterized protein n=1 Tax=bioreactor metagenome TaxID=1076179 RepID=A0A644ZLK4_9ZZZZ
MHAALVGEGALADERGIAGNSHIGDLGNPAADTGKPLKAFTAETVAAKLGSQDAGNGGEVCIAAALAETQQCSLNLHHARLYCGDGRCNSTACIIVGVDAEIDIREQGNGFLGDSLHFGGDHAPPGLAQHQGGGSSCKGRPQGSEGILLVSDIAVKVMLRIEENLGPALGDEAD